MFEPPIPSETVTSDQSPPAAAGRPCDLIVDGTRIWCDGDWERTTTTGESTIDVDMSTVLEFLRDQLPPNPHDGIDSDELTEAALSLAALEAGVRVEQLKLLAELDARDAWKADGQTGMVAWMGLQFGTRVHTARQMLGVARTMGALPAILACYTEGRIGWDQLVQLCQLATAETDAEWAADGPRFSAEDLARMVRNRRVRDDEARTAHDRRGVTVRPRRGGLTELSFLLPHDQSAVVENTLAREADRILTPNEDGTYPSRSQQLADGLVSMCEKYTGQADPGLPTVVIHGDIGLLTDEDPDGYAALPDGRPIAASILRRLAGLGRIEWAIDGPDGTTLGIGRASKVWPAWVARIIRERDGNRCRFPGCRGPIHHVHHINEWVADQGETNSSNGMGGCFTHHHLVHEGGWKVEGDANAELTFTSPDGTRVLTSRPAHLTPQLKKRLARCSTTNFDDLD